MKHFCSVAWIALLICLAGCARGRNIVVLLPDAEGQVGTLQVQTDQGSIKVDKAYQAVDISGKPVLGDLQTMTQSEVQSAFAGALAAEPAQRFVFKKMIVYCRRDSTELTPESRHDFAEMIRQIISSSPSEIYAVGHADRVGTEKYNTQLSRKRALSIQQELVAKGISSRIIVISFMGETYPQIVTPDEIEEPRNRRVELILKFNRAE
jgi:outer membrane protein OmpA-like peptidoglycan-associated protein